MCVCVGGGQFVSDSLRKEAFSILKVETKERRRKDRRRENRMRGALWIL